MARRFSQLLVAALAPALVLGASIAQAASPLRLLETHAAGGGVEGLFDPNDIAISPDGFDVYVADDDGLVAFRRDAPSGQLAFVGLVPTTALGSFAGAATVAPGGAHVYAMTGSGVDVFARDPGTGALTFVQSVAATANLCCSGHIRVSPDGTRVYAAGQSSDALVVFARDPGTGTLAQVDVEQNGVGGVSGLNEATGVAVAADHVYVTGWQDGAVAIFARDPGPGGVTFLGRVNGIPGAGHLALAPGDAQLYVHSWFAGSLFVFARDPVTGGLTFVEAESLADAGLINTKLVAVSGDGSHVYGGGLSGVATFARDPLTGALSFLSEDVPGDALVRPEAMALSADGRDLYAASGFSLPPYGGTLAQFARDAGSGHLSFVEVLRLRSGGRALASISAAATSADGRSVYFASTGDDAIVAFQRNATTGALTFADVEQDRVDGVVGLDDPEDIVVAPDGAHVYAASASDDSLVAFARDPLTSRLTHLDTWTDGEGGVDGLSGAWAVAVSPDGGQVYAGGPHDEAIAVFTRDAGTGLLTPLEVEENVELDALISVAVSPDGAHVYAGGFFLSIFSRDPTTGALTFVETLSQAVYPGRIAVSPDGEHVFVTRASSVVAFDRNPATGALTVRETASDVPPGQAEGLDGARAVVADAEHVYVAGVTDRSVVQFEQESDRPLVVVDATDPALQLGGPLALAPNGAQVYAGGSDAVAVLAHVATCPPAPSPTCRAPERPGGAKLVVKNRTPDRLDALTWAWKHGDASAAEIGTPTASDAYAFCLYDASAAPQPRIDAVAPAAGTCFGTHPSIPVPCWRAMSGPLRRLNYNDRNALTGLTPDGLGEIRLREGTDRAQLQVKGAGALLELPALPLAAPARAQLHNLATGACWDATYSAPSVNGPADFRGKSD
jgi:6-phosphogluconolactonase (cycloisomerase 2 family)